MKTDSPLKDIFQYLLAGIIVIGFFIMLIEIVARAIPLENKDLANVLFGALAMNFATVIGYFFLSNKSSDAKTQMLYNSTPIVPPRTDVLPIDADSLSYKEKFGVLPPKEKTVEEIRLAISTNVPFV